MERTKEKEHNDEWISQGQNVKQVQVREKADTFSGMEKEMAK